MPNKTTNFIAIVLLSIMLFISLITGYKDALTFDELAHIPAGYSYLKYQDLRINPEHPPLIKAISAIPLIFKDINFPLESENWQQKESSPAWWVQFDLGTEFIYRSGNDAREIIILSRIPMILMLIFLGWFTFKWARELGGNKAGIVALTLFSFSPTLIAHGRLVTTDVGAALGATLSIYYWLKFIKNPTIKTITIAGIFLGIAMLTKFSMIILLPVFALMAIFYVFVSLKEKKLKLFAKYTALSVIAIIIGIVFVIWPVYSFFIQNYPIEQQLRDTRADLAPSPVPALRDLTLIMTDNYFLRPLAQYARGFLMASQRTVLGNNVYFLGEISINGRWYYFPVIYLIKELLALHVLTLFVFLSSIVFIIKKKEKFSSFLKFITKIIRNNFEIFSLLIFILIYWLVAIASNLNIGIRHLIPTLPFLYIILAIGIKKIIKMIEIENTRKKISAIFIFILGWYVISSISAFPNYISYYNYLGGGTNNGFLKAVDSNYDWGQDFYHLVRFVKEREIDEIYIDYFGGEDPYYWLGDKYKRLNPKELNDLPKGWVAVSVNQLMKGLARPVSGFDQETGFYNWIKNYEFKGRAGKSIFIFHSR